MNDLVNLVLPCLAPMVSDVLGQLRALLRLKVVYFVLPHRCAIHGSKPPLTAAAALRSAWTPPRARRGRRGWRPGKLRTWPAMGEKKISYSRYREPPNIDRKYRKVIYHFNRIFLCLSFWGLLYAIEVLHPLLQPVFWFSRRPELNDGYPLAIWRSYEEWPLYMVYYISRISKSCSFPWQTLNYQRVNHGKSPLNPIFGLVELKWIKSHEYIIYIH